MKRNSLSRGLVAVAVLGLLGAAGYGLYMTGMNRSMGMSDVPTSTPATAPGADGMASTAAVPTASVPQSIAQGEKATRRHIAAGIKAVKSTRPPARRSFTTTTPWCRGTSSTSRPSRRSWT